MRWIATQTISGTGTTTVTFNNIPQEFQSLRFHVWGRGTFNNSGSGLSVTLGYNGYSGTNNFRHQLFGDGANPYNNSFSSSNGTVGSVPDVNAASTIYGANIIDIVDYANPNKNKTLNYMGGFDRNGSGTITMGSSFITLSTAITQVQLVTDGNWGDASRIDLYGFATSVARGA
jgi:hypothetical protein